MFAIAALGFLVLATLSITASFLLTCHAWEHRRFTRGGFAIDRQARFVGRVGVIVPCKDIDLKLKENLRCLFDQTYDNYEIYFVVERVQDPAWHIIRKLIDSENHVTAHLIVAGQSFEQGQKIHNLLCGYRSLAPDIQTIVFADCDVAPDRDWISRLTAPLQLVNVHAVSSYRWFSPQTNSFANFLLSSINFSAMGLICSRRAPVIWGGSWAISRTVFRGAEIPLRWEGLLSDDLYATARINQLRLNTYFQPRCIVRSPIDYSFSNMWEFLRRQCFMGRRYLPQRWIAGLAYTSLSMAAFWGGLLGGTSLAIAGRPQEGFAGIAVAAMLWALNVIRARLQHQAAKLYMQNEYKNQQLARWFDFCCYPLSLTTLWWALLSVAFTRCISWRGIVYHLDRSGTVLRVERDNVPRNVEGPMLNSSSSNPSPSIVPEPEIPQLKLHIEEVQDNEPDVLITPSKRRAA
ncbi:MAG: hypothetical protein CMJ74_00685 [Planctomycetaceae bacterium]|nr:hypothetical protein [Planctomycetaceae bacterium]|tara:strand:- start:1820 stop:3205 length:1386 start_codon:yes stop_codon:yes gene_type:complete